ncbi:DNAJ domain-containing protein DNAJB family protein [Schizosaccharomyces japonicus yFS275]|uniref:DNAJ domain-containing protein DNAJB family protein n=1 Tax=Schizosaccharomyces japonicus (strain yFS275 / FY16936) TaxID=402676 RepID=B6JW57_SCHJY|nr:DNAJ domain-containing protein DNAJB family protein [Schizosaccharomyces japonicus yFS275]EEB05608.1 DNAJ domain-containing protein DNAJB family protein [Schizosaccharomyces japonicus yFS275]
MPYPILRIADRMYHWRSVRQVKFFFPTRRWFAQASLHGRHDLGALSPYEVLGLPKTCSKSDIRKRYTELVKKYHPDLSADKNEISQEDRNRVFQLIVSANRLLSNERSRRAYETLGIGWENSPEPSPSTTSQSRRRTTRPNRPRYSGTAAWQDYYYNSQQYYDECERTGKDTAGPEDEGILAILCIFGVLTAALYAGNWYTAREHLHAKRAREQAIMAEDAQLRGEMARKLTRQQQVDLFLKRREHSLSKRLTPPKSSSAPTTSATKKE